MVGITSGWSRVCVGDCREGITMNVLLTQKEYEEKVEQELRAVYPWVGDALLRPSPGHINLVADFLRQVEIIAGTQALAERLHFLHIPRHIDNRLAIYITVEMCDSEIERQEALRVARCRTTYASELTCSACGDETFRKGHFCAAHSEDAAVFQEQLVKVRKQREADQSGQAFQTEEQVPQEAAIETIDGTEGAAESAEQEAGEPMGPLVQIFDQTVINALEKAAEEDSRNRQSLGQVVERLKESKAVKPLATLPEDWQEQLDRFMERFPNFAEFVDFLGDQFALATLGDCRLALPPVLFDGEAGIGKTELVLSLAEVFGTDILVLDMATAQSAAALSGSDIFWNNTRAGHLFEVLAYGRTANPIVVLDELDKIAADDRYPPDAALYQLLEPRTAAQFRDLSVPEMMLDASHTLWFAMTNQVGRVAAPIRSRFTVFQIPAPSKAQCVGIAKSIYQRLIARSPWGGSMAPEMSDAVVRRLADYPPRMIRMLIQRACGRAARQGRVELIEQDIIDQSRNRSRGIGFMSDVA